MSKLSVMMKKVFSLMAMPMFLNKSFPSCQLRKMDYHHHNHQHLHKWMTEGQSAAGADQWLAVTGSTSVLRVLQGSVLGPLILLIHSSVRKASVGAWSRHRTTRWSCKETLIKYSNRRRITTSHSTSRILYTFSAILGMNHPAATGTMISTFPTKTSEYNLYKMWTSVFGAPCIN